MDICNVTNLNSIFQNCSTLVKLPEIEKWKTDNIKHINYIFKGCSSIINVPDISKWDIKNISEISNWCSLSDEYALSTSNSTNNNTSNLLKGNNSVQTI